MIVQLRDGDHAAVLERSGVLIAELLDSVDGDVALIASELFAAGWHAGTVELTARLIEAGIDVRIEVPDG